MARSNNVGRWGEECAAEYLITKGYTIAGRNVKIGNNEMDIVAFHEGTIHFVEVKTRMVAEDDPFQAVVRAKKRHMARFAESYVRAHDLPHRPLLDLIAVVGSPEGGLVSIDHIPDAFVPERGR